MIELDVLVACSHNFVLTLLFYVRSLSVKSEARNLKSETKLKL